MGCLDLLDLLGYESFELGSGVSAWLSISPIYLGPRLYPTVSCRRLLAVAEIGKVGVCRWHRSFPVAAAPSARAREDPTPGLIALEGQPPVVKSLEIVVLAVGIH